MPEIFTTIVTVPAASLSRGDMIDHLGTRYSVLLVDRADVTNRGRVSLYVQRCDGSEARRGIYYTAGETALRVYESVLLDVM